MPNSKLVIITQFFLERLWFSPKIRRVDQLGLLKLASPVASYLQNTVFLPQKYWVHLIYSKGCL